MHVGTAAALDGALALDVVDFHDQQLERREVGVNERGHLDASFGRHAWCAVDAFVGQPRLVEVGHVEIALHRLVAADGVAAQRFLQQGALQFVEVVHAVHAHGPTQAHGLAAGNAFAAVARHKPGVVFAQFKGVGHRDHVERVGTHQRSAVVAALEQIVASALALQAEREVPEGRNDVDDGQQRYRYEYRPLRHVS